MPETKKEPEPDDAENGEESAEEAEPSRDPEETGAGEDAREPGESAPPDEPDPSAEAGRPSRKLSLIEIVSLGAIALLLIVAVLAFRSAIMSHVAVDDPDQVTDYLAIDARGKFLEIASAEVYWREPKPEERVKAGQMLVPTVRIRLAGGSGDTTFLRAVFRDAEGAIRGDVTSRRVEAGKFADTGTEEIEIAGTEGFSQKIEFVGYSMGTEYWTVELFEGPSYSGKEWSRLVLLAAAARTEKASGGPN